VLALGVSPKVHNHLHCFERVQLQVIVTAPRWPAL